MSETLLSAANERISSVVSEIVYDRETIRKRVGELARHIETDYRGRDLLVVGILKGAFIFTCDLIRGISSPVGLDFVAVSRYQPGRDQGRIRMLRDLQGEIAGRHLLLVEDIIDTGLTLHSLLGLLSRRKPSSIAVCTLLDRRDLRLVEIPIRYAGFQASEEFLIGYGLDYRDRYRNLPYIASMDLDAARRREELEPEEVFAFQVG